MIEVTCAVIRNYDDQILIVQRGEKTDHPLKWEFPGGKISRNESDEDCIIREIREELSMDIVICLRLDPVEYDYGFKTIKLIPFVCDTTNDAPVLNEHKDYKWIDHEELLEVDFSEADIPVAEQYLNTVRGSSPAGISGIKGTGADKINDNELSEIVSGTFSVKEAEWFRDLALDNPAIFRRLLDYSFSNDSHLAFRASWTLTKICDVSPGHIVPHLSIIISRLSRFDNASVIRSFMRILSQADMQSFSENEHGLLADYCFMVLGSGEMPVAIKAYAMEVLFNITVIYPQLGNELSASVRLLMEEDSSPAIMSKGRQVLKKITSVGQAR